MLGQQVEGLANGREHAQAQAVHLEHAQGGDVVLVPGHHRAAGHGGVLQGGQVHQGVPGDDEPAHVHRQVAGRPFELPGHLQHPTDHRGAGVDAGVGGEGREVVAPARQPPPMAEGPGQAVELLRRQAEHLAHLPRRRAPPVTDQRGHHAGAVSAVLAVDVLQHLLPALVLEVHVDVRGLPPGVGQEALEEQVHPHGIDGGDPQDVADRRVGGGAPPLAEDPPGAGEADDVPHGQEVAGEVQLLDEAQLVLQLPADVLGDPPPPIAPARPLGDQGPQEAHVRVPLRRQLKRRVIDELVQGEGAAIRHLHGARHGVGQVAKEPGHGSGGAHVALGVGLQEAAGPGQGGPQANGGHHVLQGLAVGVVIQRVAGGHQRGPRGLGQGPGPGDAEPVLGIEAPRHRKIGPVAEGLDDVGDVGDRGGRRRTQQRDEALVGFEQGGGGQRLDDLAPRESLGILLGLDPVHLGGGPGPHEGGGLAGQLRAQVLRPPAAHAGHQPTQPPVPPPALGQQGHGSRQALHLQGRPHDQGQAALLGLKMGPHHPMKPVGVGHRQRRHPAVDRPRHHLFGRRRPLEEGEVCPPRQLGVGRDRPGGA